MKNKAYIFLLLSPLLVGCDLFPKKEQYLILNANFVFDHFLSNNGEDLAQLLFDSAYYSFPSDVTIDKPIVAGDQLKITFNGKYDAICMETYPAQCSVTGNIKSYSLIETEIIQISSSELCKIEDTYYLDNKNVILDEEGKYVSLNEYEGNYLYLTYSIKLNELSTTSKKYIAGIYAFNPRLDL